MLIFYTANIQTIFVTCKYLANKIPSLANFFEVCLKNNDFLFGKHRFLSGLFLYLSRGKRIIFTRDIMNKKLLELLQDKCKDFGLTKKAIEDIAETIKEKVVFTGFIVNEKVHELLDGMDIALNPSLYKEAALVSNVEYEAMRLPIITTNRGGIPEYVSEDCGYILDADKNLEDQILNALERLINDKELRERMGKSGLENAKKYYRDQYYNRFIDIIN